MRKNAVYFLVNSTVGVLAMEFVENIDRFEEVM